ncbi:MAG: hypothetical protein ABSG26_10790 [Bryobacteraceae bacterium]|jgi:hypothetical protein
MSPKEMAIAEAALKRYPATNFVQLYSQIAAATGFSVDEVEEVLNDLTADFTLRLRVDPMTKRAEVGPGPIMIVEAWYEKGEMWGQPRMPLRS